MVTQKEVTDALAKFHKHYKDASENLEKAEALLEKQAPGLLELYIQAQELKDRAYREMVLIERLLVDKQHGT